jgi:hypothetical protein
MLSSRGSNFPILQKIYSGRLGVNGRVAFSEGVVLAMQRHDVEDNPVSPDELAARFCASNRSANEFQDPGSMLRGARHMVSVPLG